MAVETSGKDPSEPVTASRRSSRKRQTTQRLQMLPSSATAHHKRDSKKPKVATYVTIPALSKKKSKTKDEDLDGQNPSRRASRSKPKHSSRSKGRWINDLEKMGKEGDKEAAYVEISSEVEEEMEERNSEEEEEVEEDSGSQSGQPPKPLYNQGQKVLARDQDGLMYQAFIRRSLFGVNRNKQIQVGMVTSQEELKQKLEKNDDEYDENDRYRPGWHYFVHFSQWKANWDRWVQESDIMSLTPENMALQETIMAAHRKLQHEFKSRKKTTSGRKIDGGTFLKAWRQTLDRIILEQGQKDNELRAAKHSKKSQTTKQSKRKKKSSILSTAQLKKQIQLRMTEQLTHRPPYEIEQIALSFGLKRVLVEDWEIINSQFDMVHVLPTKITIRRALDSYLESKEVPISKNKPNAVQENGTSALHKTVTKTSWKEIIDKKEHDAKARTNAPHTQINTYDPLKANEESTSSSFRSKEVNIEEKEQDYGNDDKKNILEKADRNGKSKEAVNSTPATYIDADKSSQYSGEAELEEIDDSELERRKAWRDMADGICLLFDQSLSFRLLYTREHSQWAVLEQQNDSSSSNNLSPSEIYGCEHLLRLVCQLPALLHSVYRQQPRLDQEDQSQDLENRAVAEHGRTESSGSVLADEEFLKSILARMNDFCRFLQKNQDDLFAQRYRKKNDAERKYELRLAKRLERKRLASTVATTTFEADSTGTSRHGDLDVLGQ